MSAVLNPPVTFSKGGVTRVAYTAEQAIWLAHDGWVRSGATAPTISVFSAAQQAALDAQLAATRTPLQVADAALTAADTALSGRIDTLDLAQSPAFRPAEHNLLTWAYDPALAVNGSTLTAGTVSFVRLRVLRRVTVTNILLFVSTAGATLTANACKAALYNSTGATLLGVTGDQATAWASTGTKTAALVTPVTIDPGVYIVAFWANGTTLPALARSGGFGAANAGLSGANVRFGTANTGVTTTTPTSLTGMAPQSIAWWAALS